MMHLREAELQIHIHSDNFFPQTSHAEWSANENQTR